MIVLGHEKYVLGKSDPKKNEIRIEFPFLTEGKLSQIILHKGHGITSSYKT